MIRTSSFSSFRFYRCVAVSFALCLAWPAQMVFAEEIAGQPASDEVAAVLIDDLTSQDPTIDDEAAPSLADPESASIDETDNTTVFEDGEPVAPDAPALEIDEPEDPGAFADDQEADASEGGADVQGGWLESDGIWTYTDPATGEALKDGFHEVDGSVYYFNERGERVSGWLSLGNDTYYLDSSDGHLLKDGIYEIDGQGYFFRPAGSEWGPEGSLGKGWVLGYGEESDDYFFDRSSGKMVTGIASIDGDRFLFGEDGAACGGWATEGGYSYLFDETSHRMLSNGIYPYDGESYYLRPAGSSWGPKGSMGHGWVANYGGNSFFFDREDGHMLKGGIYPVDDSSYYFRPADSEWGPEGSMGKGWVRGYGEESDDYFFDRHTGKMVTGALTIDGDRYLFDGEGAAMTGWAWFDGNWYYLDADKKMARGGIFDVDDSKYYFRPAGSPWGPEGSMGSGWVRNLGGQSYFFDRSDGRMLSGGIFGVDGASYYFRPAGSPWGPEGSMGKGWVYGEDGPEDDRFFDRSTGAMLVNGVYVIGREAYSADSNGVLTIASFGQLLSAASAAQKKIASIAWSEPTTPSGWCALWVHNVFERYGITDVYGNACDLYNDYCTSTNPAELKVGMIVAVSRHPGTPGGRIYGHIGIYVGNGVMLDSSGSIRTWYVGDWADSYDGWVPAKWGWYGGKSLA